MQNTSKQSKNYFCKQRDFKRKFFRNNITSRIYFRAIKYDVRIHNVLQMAYPAVNINFTKFNSYLLQGLIDQEVPASVLKQIYMSAQKIQMANQTLIPTQVHQQQKNHFYNSQLK